MKRSHTLIEINRAATDLEHLLTAALARLDRLGDRDRRTEETTAGTCYGREISTGPTVASHRRNSAPLDMHNNQISGV